MLSWRVFRMCVCEAYTRKNHGNILRKNLYFSHNFHKMSIFVKMGKCPMIFPSVLVVGLQILQILQDTWPVLELSQLFLWWCGGNFHHRGIIFYCPFGFKFVILFLVLYYNCIKLFVWLKLTYDQLCLRWSKHYIVHGNCPLLNHYFNNSVTSCPLVKSVFSPIY